MFLWKIGAAKIQAIPISAKTGEGIDDLLSPAMLVESEMLELKANSDSIWHEEQLLTQS